MSYYYVFIRVGFKYTTPAGVTIRHEYDFNDDAYKCPTQN